MSVTFRAAQPPVAWEINTWCDTTVPDVADRDDATTTARLHALGCTECAEQGGAHMWPVEAIEPVQMSNGNAAEVLAVLGYPADELAGAADPQELAGRALIARAMLDESPERPSETIRNTGGATIINLGRDAGYINRRVDEILTLAQAAAEAGVDVHWG